MTKYNVYESITLSGCDPINTWVASFLHSDDATNYMTYLNQNRSYHNSIIRRSYHIHSETD